MFDNFISLGNACPTASSMSKYGLRGWSGPFDWLVTPSLEKLLYLIECDFEDFLWKENLRICPDHTKQFKDQKYEILFCHDGIYSIPVEKDYQELCEKYQRKIRRFRKEIKKKCCFLRSVSDEAELAYIVKQKDYINKVIKMDNKESEIVFLVKKELKIPDGLGFRSYLMPGQYSGASKRTLRSWFDGSEEFLTYCGHNYDMASLMKNIAFDHKKKKNSQR